MWKKILSRLLRITSVLKFIHLQNLDFYRFYLIDTFFCNALSNVFAEFKFLALAARALELKAYLGTEYSRFSRVSFMCIPLGCVAAIP